MRILFITPYLPLLTKPRPFRFIEHLAQSHEVHLVAFDISQDRRYADRPDYQHLRTLCATLTLLPLPRNTRYANVARSLFSADPARVAYYGSHRFIADVADLIERHAIDMIHVDRLRLAPLAQDFPLPKVIDATDAISEYLRQCVRYLPVHLKPAYAFEAAKTERFERHAADAYNRCLVTTERERLRYAHSHYFSRVRAIPSILDPMWFERESGSDRPERPTVLFAGNLSYLPNVDAVEYMARRIWPRVRRDTPDARLVITGAVPSSRVRRLAQSMGAELTGFVPDLAAVVAAATVVVSPMRIGVGFPHKLADALALGKAIVTTSAGCGGLAESQDALLVADDPESFAGQITGLIRDPDARGRLESLARAYARETLHPTRIKAQFDAVYAEVLRGGQTPAGQRLATFQD